jgi:hypothetical protein
MQLKTTLIVVAKIKPITATAKIIFAVQIILSNIANQFKRRLI